LILNPAGRYFRSTSAQSSLRPQCLKLDEKMKIEIEVIARLSAEK
jgi:hypothetical protein